MRTTLKIDDDVYADARLIALKEGQSLGAVISELARRSLRPVAIRTTGGFPVFDVPDDAPPMTTDDVARAVDQE